MIFTPLVVARPGKDFAVVEGDSAVEFDSFLNEHIVKEAPVFNIAVQKALFTKGETFGMYITDECNEVKHGKQIKYVYNRLKKAELVSNFRLGVVCKDLVQSLV